MKLPFLGVTFVGFLSAAAVVCAETPSQLKPDGTEATDTQANDAGKAQRSPQPSQHVRQLRHHGDLWDDVDEQPSHRRWFSFSFLSLPLGDVVAKGSLGINPMFGKLHGVDSVKYSPSPKRLGGAQQAVLPAEAPPPLAPETKPWEIVTSEGGVTDSNGSVCHYGWKIVILNNTDAEVAVSGDVDFVDTDGHTVDGSKVPVARMAPHSEHVVTGSKMMMADSAQTIARPVAKLSRQ